MSSSELESRLLALAIAEGLVHPEDLSAIPPGFDPPTAVWGPRIQRLLEAGRLDREHLEGWLRGIQHEGASEVPTTRWSADGAPVGLPGDQAFPERREPRYRDLELVGVGGAGRVYKAFDTLLQRWVALKFLRWEWSRVGDRLLAEARAQARVKHPHVRDVFEVGDMGPEAYLAMRWVEGEPLNRVAPRLDWRACAALMVQVCEGVHAAHREGLLHLDLKPGNILVEGAEGRWHPFVTDFGMVADMSAEGPPGVLGGTLPYASPEQLQRGAPLDPRSDVHALGVTLLVTLTGKLPHEPQAAEGRGIRGEVPPDLLRVARRAMAAEPGIRHESAWALAEDLRRVLERRPIASRQHLPFHRAGLWIRRNPALAAALALAAIFAGSAGGWSLALRRREAGRARLAQRFGEEIQATQALLRLCHLSPPHDRRGEVRDVRGRMERLRAAMAEVGEGATGPGQAALARIHMLLEEWPQAREAYGRAWAAGARDPETARNLGMLQALAYMEERYDEQDAPTGDPERLARIRALRDSALAMMARGRAAGGGPGGPDVLDVLVAETEDRGSDAERLGEEALAAADRAPWNYEPWRLAMEVWDARVQHLLLDARLPEAERLLGLLERAVARAIAVGRSDPNLYALRGYVAFDRASLEQERRRDAEPHLLRAVASFREAGAIDPDLTAAARWGADGLRRLAAARMQKGDLRTELLDEAERLILPVCGEGHPRRLRNQLILVRILARRALQRTLLGQDPAWDLRRARGLLASLPPPGEGFEHYTTWDLTLELAEALHKERQGRLENGEVAALGQRFGETRADRGEWGPRSPAALAEALAARVAAARGPGAAEGLRRGLARYLRESAAR